MIFNKREESGHPCLVSSPHGKACSYSSCTDNEEVVNYRFSINSVYQVEEVSLSS